MILGKYFFIICLSIFYLEASPSSINIMLLGDSITYDDAYIDYPEFGGIAPRPASLRHGYRNYLWYLLKNAHYNVNFVGSRVAGTDITPSFDPDNEGYPGYTSQDIANIVYSKLQQNPPDIILLHIGTNDWSDDVAYISYILDEINRYERNYNHPIKVIVARIINRRNNVSIISHFNINLQNLINSRNTHGDDIHVVDMEHHAGINYTNSDFQDPTHPNNSGYVKIANAWFNALKDILKDIIPHTRVLSDVNGDGLSDVIAFGINGVTVALSTGSNFDVPNLWLTNFGYRQGWEEDKTLRKVADVNGDGMADIIGFGYTGISIALSNGSGFDPATLWLADFGYNQGWRKNRSLRILADVNGDGNTDIVGFGNNGVSVALSNGNSFVNAARWVNDFGYNQGWRNNKGLRFMSDVNGDGKSDIVGFGNNGVSVALSNGNSFVNAARWINDFGYNQGWRNNKGLRFMSDVNGDGKSDIVGFGNNGVSIALSNGNSFINAARWVNNFGYNQGWRNNKGLRFMSDVNGDGKSDIVGFGNNGVSVALSNGRSFEHTARWLTDLGYNQNWRNIKHLRLSADMDGDGSNDIVGFGNTGISVATSNNVDLSNANLWLNDLGYNQGWRINFTPNQAQQ